MLPEGAVTLLEWPDRAAGFLPRRPARHRVDAVAAARAELPRSARVTGYGSFAARAERIAAIRQFLDRVRLRRGRAPAHPGRRLDARLRAARPATARSLHPDEFAEAAGRAAGARRQALQRNRASGRKRDAVRRDGARVARARAFGAGDICRRPRRGAAGASKISATSRSWTATRRRRSRRAMKRRPTPARRIASARPCQSVLPVEPGVDYRLPRYDMDALLIEVELLLDWYLPQARASRFRYQARRLSGALARSAAADRSRTHADLGAARFSFAQSALAAGARGHRARRPARFPGRGDGAGRLRSRLAAAGRPRRRAGDDGDRAALALRARAACRRPGFDAAELRAGSTPRSPRSARRKILGIFARLDSATASRNICVTCRGYGAICSARWRIRRWRRSRPGTAPTCRR